MIAHLAIANLAARSGPEDPPAYSWTGDENPVYTEFPGVTGAWSYDSEFFISFSHSRPAESGSAFFLVQMIDPTNAVYLETEIPATSVLTNSSNYLVRFELAAPSYPEYFTPRVTCRETNPVSDWPAVNGAAAYGPTF